jgi:3-oxoacyl-[acyl-carrier-protein] synthase-1
LRQGLHALKPCDFESVDLPTFIGEVAGVDEVQLAPGLADYNCRNNRLAQLALQQDGFAVAVNLAATKYGRERIGVFLGTSTSAYSKPNSPFVRATR